MTGQWKYIIDTRAARRRTMNPIMKPSPGDRIKCCTTSVCPSVSLSRAFDLFEIGEPYKLHIHLKIGVDMTSYQSVLNIHHGIWLRESADRSLIAEWTECHDRRAFTKLFNIPVFHVDPHVPGQPERVVKPVEADGGIGSRSQSRSLSGGCDVTNVSSSVATSTATNDENSSAIHADSTTLRSASNPRPTTPPTHSNSVDLYTAQWCLGWVSIDS